MKTLINEHHTRLAFLLSLILLFNFSLVTAFNFDEGVSPSVTFEIELVQGKIPGASVVHKFGRNSDIDAGFEAIWNGGDNYTGFNPSVAEYIQLTSDNSADTSSGTGARTLQIYGLDANYLEINETITLTGTAGVNSTLQYIRMNRMIVRTAGDAGHNVGQLTARQNITLLNIMAVMPAEYSQTMISAYTVPAGKSAYMESWFATMASKVSGASDVRLKARPFGEVFQVKEQLALDSTGSSYVERLYITPKGGFPEKTDIFIEADSSVGNLGVSAGFDLVLYTN